MKKLIDTTPTGFEPEVAARKAAELAAGDDDGWTYKVRHAAGARFAYIDIFDEDGNFVDTFGSF